MKKKDLLFVDDEPFIRETASTYFSEGKYKLRLCADGSEALQALKESSFFCALIDFELPDMSGLELAQRLRTIDPSLPLVFMSGFDLELLDQVQLPQQSDFIIKPFRFQELVERIEKRVYES